MDDLPFLYVLVLVPATNQKVYRIGRPISAVVLFKSLQSIGCERWIYQSIPWKIPLARQMGILYIFANQKPQEIVSLHSLLGHIYTPTHTYSFFGLYSRRKRRITKYVLNYLSLSMINLIIRSLLIYCDSYDCTNMIYFFSKINWLRIWYPKTNWTEYWVSVNRYMLEIVPYLNNKVESCISLNIPIKWNHIVRNYSEIFLNNNSISFGCCVVKVHYYNEKDNYWLFITNQYTNNFR